MITSSAGELRTSADVYISELGESSCELDAVPKFFKNALPAIASHGSVVSFCVRVLPPEVDVAWTVCGRDITNASKGFTVSILVLVLIIHRALFITRSFSPKQTREENDSRNDWSCG